MCNWVKSGNQRIDPCFREGIAALNNLGKSLGIKTLACCCGHGRYCPTIIIEKPDGTICDFMSDIIIPRKKRFYRRDKDGYFFVPEVELAKQNQVNQVSLVDPS